MSWQRRGIDADPDEEAVVDAASVPEAWVADRSWLVGSDACQGEEQHSAAEPCEAGAEGKEHSREAVVGEKTQKGECCHEKG